MQVKEVKVTLNNGKSIGVHRVNNDSYGNPRYAIHYSNIADNYSEALAIAKKKIGGKRYTAKWYGGWIVFQAYNLKATLETLFDIQ